VSVRARASALLLVLPLLAGSAGAQPRIEVVPNEAERRVDVTVDGKPFTSYIWPASQKKPVLFPVRSAKGTLVTRGFPLEPRPGERVDHPHHVGLWFNHGDVNGLDFWNNSDDIPANRASKMGTIVHQKVVHAKGGAGHGELTVESEWRKPDGTALLRETTQYVFGGSADSRTIDRVTALSALGERVVFTDNKEGVLGLRVARALEQPSTKPEMLTDSSGRPGKVPVLDNTGVTGQYTSSENLKGDAVWGTRGRWTMLTGTVESEPVTVVMLDHPSNPGYPTYWHARGYGLFAANPMGENVFTEGKKALNVSVEPGASIVFRHRILILGNHATPEAIEQQFRAFSGS
jgi:hypothetical protein